MQRTLKDGDLPWPLRLGVAGPPASRLGISDDQLPHARHMRMVELVNQDDTTATTMPFTI